MNAPLKIGALLLMAGCGGFTTPPQEVTVGLALSPSLLPPRSSGGGHTLELTRVRFGLARARVRLAGAGGGAGGGGEGGGSAERFELASRLTEVSIDLNTRWSPLVSAPIPRGQYRELSLELASLRVEGTWDGAPFSLTARDTQSERAFELKPAWVVVVGKASTVSLVTNPTLWLSRDEKPGDLIDPSSTEAAGQLLGRFLESVAPRRDDDHDAVEDP